MGAICVGYLGVIRVWFRGLVDRVTHIIRDGGVISGGPFR